MTVEDNNWQQTLTLIAVIGNTVIIEDQNLLPWNHRADLSKQIYHGLAIQVSKKGT